MIDKKLHKELAKEKELADNINNIWNPKIGEMVDFKPKGL